MKRRGFLQALAGAFVAAPVVVEAAKPAKFSERKIVVKEWPYRVRRVEVDLSAIRDKNVLLSAGAGYEGRPIVTFRNIPIKLVDQL